MVAFLLKSGHMLRVTRLRIDWAASNADGLRVLNVLEDLKAATTVPLKQLLGHLNLLRGLVKVGGRSSRSISSNTWVLRHSRAGAQNGSGACGAGIDFALVLNHLLAH